MVRVVAVIKTVEYVKNLRSLCLTIPASVILNSEDYKFEDEIVLCKVKG